MKNVVSEAIASRGVRDKLAQGVAKDLSRRLAYTQIRDQVLGGQVLLLRSLERLIAGEKSLKEVGRDVERELEGDEGLRKKLEHSKKQLRQAWKKLRDTKHSLLISDRLAAVGELSLGLVHEINNPLGTIKGLIQLLREGENLSASQRKDLGIIECEIKGIQQISKKLQSFSRPHGLEMQPVNVHALLNDIVSFMSHRFLRQQVQLVKQYDPEVSTLVADPYQLKQVFTNLLLNAVQAMPNGGMITLKTERKGRSVNFVVSDTGSGITRPRMKKIFNPFFTTRKQGTGLGLAVTQNIVRNHKGRIAVSSRVGRGTTFTIALPLKPMMGSKWSHAG